MLHKQHCRSVNKRRHIKVLSNRQSLSNDFTYGEVQESFSSRRVVYPVGKPIMLHLLAGPGSYELRCQGFGVPISDEEPKGR